MTRLMLSILICALVMCPVRTFAGLREAKTAYDAMHYDKALDELEPLARQNDPEAQFFMGWMYHNGYGVRKNHQTAVKWYLSAALQGHARAQFMLGTMCLHGDGIQQNDAEGVVWFRMAAKQGYAPAQRAMGLLHENGTAVSQDYTEAISWYRKAAGL